MHTRGTDHATNQAVSSKPSDWRPLAEVSCMDVDYTGRLRNRKRHCSVYIYIFIGCNVRDSIRPIA